MIADVREAIGEKKPLRIPGRGKVRKVRDDKVLIGLVDSLTRADGGVSDFNLSQILGTSRMTINRVRHDLKFSYKPLRHGPLLSELQIERRRVFCHHHRNSDWSKTLFTEESRFSTSPDCPTRWWVKRGDHVYAESNKFPFSIMVWGGIVGQSRTPLVECPKTLNPQSYVEMLERNGIVDFLAGIGENAIFQQDGASCHTAASTIR